MAGGIDINFPWPGTARKERQKRADDITEKLISTTDLDPMEINAIRKQILETGTYDLPTSRTTPPKVGIGPSQVEPIKDFRRNQGVYQIGPNGLMNLGTTPKGSKIIDQTKPRTGGANNGPVPVYTYNSETGQLEAVGTMPHGGRVIQPKPEDPLTALVRERDAGKSKELTKEIAQQFLQQASGDKDKARQLARDAGYKF